MWYSRSPFSILPNIIPMNYLIVPYTKSCIICSWFTCIMTANNHLLTDFKDWSKVHVWGRHDDLWILCYLVWVGMNSLHMYLYEESAQIVEVHKLVILSGLVNTMVTVTYTITSWFLLCISLGVNYMRQIHYWFIWNISAFFLMFISHFPASWIWAHQVQLMLFCALLCGCLRVWELLVSWLHLLPSLLTPFLIRLQLCW